MFLTCYGAAEEVTGSCHLLELKDVRGDVHQILIDCGMFQGERMCGGKNFAPFGFDPKKIEAVFVTHPHADHTARLPKLVREGYTGFIYATHPGLSLTRIVLEDTFHVMSDNAKRCADPVLYDMEDVAQAYANMRGVGYHEQVTVAPGITVMFHDAGHILGSAYISIEAEGKRLVFSGDIGNDHVPILPDTEPLSEADIVVCESTYGGRLHEPTATRNKKLIEVLEQVVKDKGVLMIPAFSIERTQELLYAFDQILLHQLKTNIPIYLDSPMAIRATEVYRKYQNMLEFDASILDQPDRDFFSFPNLRETLTVDESKTINDAKGSKVIIAGSGMMSGGRIMHHLLRYLSDKKNTLLIIGYQANGTLGREIYDGARFVHIFGEKIPVRCKIMAIGAFSAHGDQAKLTRWLHPTNKKDPKQIFLVHGDLDQKQVFAKHLKKEFKKTEVIIPRLAQRFEMT